MKHEDVLMQIMSKGVLASSTLTDYLPFAY